MSNSESLTKMVALRLTPSDRKRLEKHADERMRDAAELARMILVEWLDNADNNNTKEKKYGRKGS